MNMKRTDDNGVLKPITLDQYQEKGRKEPTVQLARRSPEPVETEHLTEDREPYIVDAPIVRDHSVDMLGIVLSCVLIAFGGLLGYVVAMIHFGVVKM